MGPLSSWGQAVNQRLSDPFFATTEGRLLLIGLALGGLMALAFGVAWYLFPDTVPYYAAMTGLNLVIGRAAGMTFGYASGFGHAQVIPLNMLIETIQVLVVYPLFSLSWRQLIHVSALQSYVARIHRAAESRSGMARRFGVIGLFVFVFVPFWMTGPVVGSIIGFLIGLRPWVNVSVVLISTYLAIAVWALLLNELSAWAATVNQFAPYALVISVVLLGLVMQLLNRQRNRRKKPGK